jgi:ubiquinone biosynthesis protein
MQVQPHLLLLQKTMVMVEGMATTLNPAINMWDIAAPFVKDWIRDELGPEAMIADRLRADTQTLLRLPDLIRRIEDRFPAKGGAPEQAPLPEIALMWDKRERPGRGWLGYGLAALGGGAVAVAAMAAGLIAL